MKKIKMSDFFFYLKRQQKSYSDKGGEKSAFIVNSLLTIPSK